MRRRRSGDGTREGVIGAKEDEVLSHDLANKCKGLMIVSDRVHLDIQGYEKGRRRNREDIR